MAITPPVEGLKIIGVAHRGVMRANIIPPLGRVDLVTRPSMTRVTQDGDRPYGLLCVCNKSNVRHMARDHL